AGRASVVRVIAGGGDVEDFRGAERGGRARGRPRIAVERRRGGVVVGGAAVVPRRDVVARPVHRRRAPVAVRLPRVRIGRAGLGGVGGGMGGGRVARRGGREGRGSHRRQDDALFHHLSPFTMRPAPPRAVVGATLTPPVRLGAVSHRTAPVPTPAAP